MGLNEILLQQDLMNETITWLFFIIVPAFVGSYASDYMKTVKDNEMKVSLIRVILATAVSCIITYVVLEWLIGINKKPVVPFIALVLGSIGFEILHGFSSIDNMIKLVKKISKLLSPITTLITQINEIRRLSVANSTKQNDETPKEEKPTDDKESCEGSDTE